MMRICRICLTATLVLTFSASILTGCKAQQEKEDKQTRIQEYLERAEVYREQGLEDSAFAMFGQALLENPRVVDAHMGIGDIYKKRGDYDKASVRFELSAAIDPENYNAHYNLGVCKQVLGDLPFAIKAYKRALNLRPDSSEANRDIASAYLQDGKSGLALTFAERAAKLQPNSFATQANLGFIYAQNNQMKKAVTAFRSASELAEKDDDLTPVLLGLGDAHVRMGNYELALNTLKALVIKSPSSTAYERMGVAYFKQRKYEEALENFKKAVELDATDTAALNGQGVVYMTLYIEGGRSNTWQRDQALKSWSKSLEIKPGQNQIILLVSRYNNI